jgi:uncharacterized membrane protein YphA (DoxX/SURF4 family)
MKTKILFVLCLLVGLLFINAGLNKFLDYMPVPEDLPEAFVQMMQAMMQMGWLMPLVGVAEIVGGVLFAIPRTRALGAIVLFPLMVGILLAHFYADPSTLVMPLVFFGIMVWAMVESRAKYLPMIR